MQETLESLLSIQEKITLVQQRIEEQKKEINDLLIEKEILTEQLKGIQTENTAKTETIQEMEQQLQVLKLAKTISDEDEVKKTELKKMIQQMIKEVDKCLAVVNVN